MSAVYVPLLVLHISAAALLIGAGTGMLKNLRRTAALSREAFGLAVEDAARRAKVMMMSSLTTLLTGLCLIFLLGGFAVVPLNIHIALSLMLVAQVVSATIMRPGVGQLVKLAGESVWNPSAVDTPLKKLAMGQGILHLLWLGMLVLMLVRINR